MMIGKQNIFHSARGERWYCVVFLDGKKGTLYKSNRLQLY